jgi:SAM-dependent methyltransferase
MLPYERMSDIHRAASEGFSREVSSYTRGRPGYPDELLRWLRGQLRLDGDRTVVELGAGTGKFTQLLLQTGAELIAIEPVEAMREKLKRNLPGVKAMAGTAQAIPLKDRVANAVVCAQAFHWFATREALAQIHRVLKPGGYLGLIWNVRDESVDWVAAITEIISPYEGDAPRFLSVSFIAALPPAQKARVADKLKALILTHPQLKDRPLIALPYQTHAYWCDNSPTP